MRLIDNSYHDNSNQISSRNILSGFNQVGERSQMCFSASGDHSATVAESVTKKVWMWPAEIKNGPCVCVCVAHWLSHSWLLAAPWTVAHWAPLSMEFFRQEYWNGLQFPPLGDLPKPGIEAISLESPTLAGRFFTTCATWEA